MLKVCWINSSAWGDNMRSVIAKQYFPVSIGIQGENKAVQVLFPIESLLEDVENKEYTLLIRRDDGTEPYTPELVSVSESGSFLVWIPTFNDTRKACTMCAEIKAVGNNRKERSATYHFTVEKSVEYANDI